MKHSWEAEDEDEIIIPIARKPGVYSDEDSLSNNLSINSNESTNTFSKQPNKLVPPVSPDLSVLEYVKTDGSGESVGEVNLNPLGIKLRNKFNEIQLKQWNREEIYWYLCTLDHIYSKQYKIKKYHQGGKDIEVWAIAKGGAVDMEKEWIINFTFYNDRILVEIKWEIEVHLLKELLDWLHSLTFQFIFYINSEYLKRRRNNLNEWIHLISNGLNLKFYCSIITFKFEGKIKEDINDKEKQYWRELFKLIMQVDWAVFIETLVWNNYGVWKIIKDWLVILL